MTCIAGIAQDGKVWIGGDSAGVGGLSLTVRADEKVFAKGEMVFGFTSSFRMGDLLRYSFGPPEQTSRQDDREYLCTSFVNALRDCFASGGFKRTTDGADSGGTFLLGYKGALYCIHSDFQVALAADGYDAVGCGDDVALGALYATGGEPKKRILTALEAAERFSAGVRAPFKVVSL